MKMNAVTHLFAHKLARNKAANSHGDLTGDNKPSQTKPLHQISMFAKNPRRPGSFRSQPSSARKLWPGTGANTQERRSPKTFAHHMTIALVMRHN